MQVSRVRYATLHRSLERLLKNEVSLWDKGSLGTSRALNAALIATHAAEYTILRNGKEKGRYSLTSDFPNRDCSQRRAAKVEKRNVKYDKRRTHDRRMQNNRRQTLKNLKPFTFANVNFSTRASRVGKKEP